MDIQSAFENAYGDIPQPEGRIVATMIRAHGGANPLETTGAVLAKAIVENAHLREINAELLAALKEILPVYEMWTEDGGHDPSVGVDATPDWARIENAKAVIARAESE